MATKTLNIANIIVTDYDDAIVTEAINTDGVVKVTRAPSGNDEILRFQDGAIIVGIGTGIDGSTAGSVLFIDTNSLLAEDTPNFTYSEISGTLTFPSMYLLGRPRYVQTEIDNIDSPYALDVDDSYIFADSTAGNITINLPALAGSKRVLVVKNVGTGGNTVSVTPNGTDTLDGTAAALVLNDGDKVTLFERSTDWTSV